MAKRPVKPAPIDEDELPPPESPDAIADEANPGESMDDYMERMDEQDAQWTDKKGGRGAQKHDQNESRHKKVKVPESWDPHMGDC